MNTAPRSVRPHIVILGKCNAGKSTLINALCNQNVAIVSEQRGTTTDPVYKSMELLPYGPVVMVDTAGLDDLSELGRERIKRTWRAIRRADLVIVLLTAEEPDDVERETLEKLKQRRVAVITVRNVQENCLPNNSRHLCVNALTGTGVHELREHIAKLLTRQAAERPLVRDLLDPVEGPVILVTPIDKAAPKGRLILPQVQTLRDVIDGGITAVVCRETELAQTFKELSRPPQLVITDSQVFGFVAEVVPRSVPLTSFSILMARYKGDIDLLYNGAQAIKKLKPGDRVLIAEACTHHRQEDDIGTVKIPRLLQNYVGGELQFEWVSGQSFKEDLTPYKLIVHCGGCMINRQEMLSRLKDVMAAGVPIVNYGVLLAFMNGILERSMEPIWK